jgi:ArsR family transcriptional regulator
MFNHEMTGDQGRLRRDPAAPHFHAHPSKIARIRRRLLDEHAGAVLADTFKVLGDLTRVRILDALAQAELCVCDLAALVGLSESAVSHQLRLLRGMRVVRPRRAGRMVFYALDDEHVVALFEQGLRHIEEAAGRGPVAPRAADDGGRASHGRRGAATRLAR